MAFSMELREPSDLTNISFDYSETATLAYVSIIGTPTRFQRGKQIGTYVGVISCEDSSAHKS
jgi:hypothetical protein